MASVKLMDLWILATINNNCENKQTLALLQNNPLYGIKIIFITSYLYYNQAGFALIETPIFLFFGNVALPVLQWSKKPNKIHTAPENKKRF